MRIELKIDAELPGLRAARSMLARPRPIMVAAAGGVARVVRTHFTTRDAEGNEKGWPSSHFFAREGARRTSVDRESMGDDGAAVLIASKQMAFRQRGGTVRPGSGKRYLAIPATAEAYKIGRPGNRPQGELVFALAAHPQGGRRPALVRQYTTEEEGVLRGKSQRVMDAKTEKGRARAQAAADKAAEKIARRGRQLEVQYWLVRAASIQPDPRVLPPQMVLELEAVSAASDYISSRIRAADAAAAQPPQP